MRVQLKTKLALCSCNMSVKKLVPDRLAIERLEVGLNINEIGLIKVDVNQVRHERKESIGA
jgi:hypothetical protein